MMDWDSFIDGAVKIYRLCGATEEECESFRLDLQLAASPSTKGT